MVSSQEVQEHLCRYIVESSVPFGMTLAAWAEGERERIHEERCQSRFYRVIHWRRKVR